MTYIPGRSALIAYKNETGVTSVASTITESPDNVTPATLPAKPTLPTIIGYTNQVPEGIENFNPKKGNAGGSGRPLYDGDGNQEPSIAFNLAFGSTGFLASNACLIDQTTEDLQYVAIFLILKGIQTIVYRFCKRATLDLAIQEGNAQEVTAACRFEAMTVEYNGVVQSPTISQVKAVGQPLYYHDVHQTLFAGLDLRKWFGGMTINVASVIERKNIRPNFGHDQLLSNTAYELLVNNTNTSGSLTFHDRLSDALFRGSASARLWGDATIPISNVAAGGSNTANLTVKNMVPQIRRMGGGDTGRQIGHTIPFLADDLLIATS